MGWHAFCAMPLTWTAGQRPPRGDHGRIALDMLHGHIIRPHAKRPIAALLVMGSMMGFVMGQQLGHPAREHIAHTTSQSSGVVAHAAGNLGTVPVAAPRSVAVHASAPAKALASQP